MAARPALGAPVGTAGAARVAERSSRGADGARRGLSLLGRLGLAGRTGFYVVLAGITVRIALLGRSNHEPDAAGALTLVCRTVPGRVAVGAVAVGFVLLGVGRLAGAVVDSSPGWPRRCLTAAQGVFYLGASWVPASFLAGDHAVGSQGQQQASVLRVLGLPGGRVLLVAVGVVLVVACALQARNGLARRFTDGLDMRHAPPPVRRLARVAGVVGIPARAAVFVPVGVGLVVAGVTADARHALGTDRELLDLAGHPWGVALLVLVAAGLTVFAVFSAIETRYRVVVSAR